MCKQSMKHSISKYFQNLKYSRSLFAPIISIPDFIAAYGLLECTQFEYQYKSLLNHPLPRPIKNNLKKAKDC